MLTLRMAFRNILRQKRRTLFTGASVAGGFALAVIFIGWIDGSYDNIIDRFTRDRLGHIQIHRKTYIDRPSLYKTISGGGRIGEVLDTTAGVVSWAPRAYAGGLAADGEASAGVEVVGIDPEREEATTAFAKKVIRGEAFSGPRAVEAIFGSGLAEVLQARIGDSIAFVSQAADGSIAQALFRLVGVVSTGDEASDRAALYLPLATMQDLFVLDGKVHEIAVIVDRLGRVDRIAASLTRRLDRPDLSVETWKVFARSFYRAMRADKAGMWVLLVVIVMIVAVGVLNTVLMSVLERRREYGLLKALGTRPAEIVRLVLLEVMILSLTASAIGAALGLGANAFLSRHGIRFGEGLTYGGVVFDTMKSEINARSFIIPAITVLVCAALVSLFPAVKASRTEPARTMRTR